MSEEKESAYGPIAAVSSLDAGVSGRRLRPQQQDEQHSRTFSGST